MPNNRQVRKGKGTVTRGPNGAGDQNSAALFRLRPRELHNKLAVHHIIRALHAIGALCGEVGNMLSAQMKADSFVPPRKPKRDSPEVRGVSLDPSTFIDPEEEQGNAA